MLTPPSFGLFIGHLSTKHEEDSNGLDMNEGKKPMKMKIS